MKRFLSVMLAVVMVITIFPSAVFAVADAPLELVASINENEAIIKLNTTEKFEMSALDFSVNVPEGCTITAITKGADYAATGAGEPSIDLNNVCILASQFNTATIIPSGMEFIVITVDTTNANSNTLNFSIEITAAADFEDNTHAWEGALVTSNNVTVACTENGVAPTDVADTKVTVTVVTDASGNKTISGIEVTDTDIAAAVQTEIASDFGKYFAENKNIVLKYYTGFNFADGNFTGTEPTT